MSIESDSPDLRGKRVVMDADDHMYAGREGEVIDQEPCMHASGPCGSDWLIVRLDDGTKTQVYEPEASVVGQEAGSEATPKDLGSRSRS